MAEEAAVQVAEKAAGGRLTLGIGDNLLDALLGYLVVFIGLTLLMTVVIIVGKVMVARTKKPVAEKAAVPAPAPAPAPAPVKKELAPGSAGEVKIYDTDPRDAAMIMAIVADKLQKPLNELRFVSIKEVK
ncbi:MAG: OadG family protein [Clostridiales bacterium]|nr:OadG family protein [Clostridiales bacterium]